MAVRNAIVVFAVTAALHAAALAEPPEPVPTGSIRGVVTDRHLGPLSGATVVLTTVERSTAVAAGFTNVDGRFQFSGLPPDRYEVLAVYGDARVMTRDISVGEGPTSIAPLLEISPEVVTIHEDRPMEKPAVPRKAENKRLLPWSDQAMDEDRWAVGWLLLDIDKTGSVTAFRFLHRPGIGLDEIARQEAFKLRFDPARDVEGNAIASQLLWKMEWPAYWWWNAHYMVPTPTYLSVPPPMTTANRPASMALAVAGRHPAHGYNGDGFLLSSAIAPPPPCKASGPLNLDKLGGPHANQHYRDCSPPDLERAMTEPLIKRE